MCEKKGREYTVQSFHSYFLDNNNNPNNNNNNNKNKNNNNKKLHLYSEFPLQVMLNVLYITQYFIKVHAKN